MGANVTTLQTERLLLRPPQLSDAEIIAELAGDYDVAINTLRMPHPYELEMAIEWVKHLRERDDNNSYTFAMERLSDHAFIGVIGFSVDSPNETAEIGYWVGKPYWGKGYAPGAAQAIVDYCFEELELNRIQARYYTSNDRSKRVMEKIGMMFEGISRQAIIREIPALNYRVCHDLGQYAILREDWLAKRG